MNHGSRKEPGACLFCKAKMYEYAEEIPVAAGSAILGETMTARVRHTGRESWQIVVSSPTDDFVCIPVGFCPECGRELRKR